MKELVVVGGSGFIGSRLCARLNNREGLTFLIADKVSSKAFPAKTIIADVRSISQLRSAIPDGAVIVNLAAEHRDDVRPTSLYDEVNVEGAKNLCRVAQEKNISTIIFTSTVAVYGFAPIGTDETGAIAPFNHYGRSKAAAEEVFRAWQTEDSNSRTLVIVRPTVAFGEQNRGNVYNLLKQINSVYFIMIGDGQNRKSMAYVENIAAFLEYSLKFGPGVHIFNYVDKPDFTMDALVGSVKNILGKPAIGVRRIPFFAGFLVGKAFDFISVLSGRRFSISSIRVKKFCSNSVFNSAIDKTDFIPPSKLVDALRNTVQYEFIESHDRTNVFYTE